MIEFDRRTVLGLSLGAFSLVRDPVAALAQSCTSGSLPSFLPNRLTVDCASGRNFQVFRRNASYLGLAGVVNMSYVRGKLGAYNAGNLFLFPWLKPPGRTLIGKNWGSMVPTSASASVAAGPIPDTTLPLDEYFCNFLLKAAPATFIGFNVDLPYSKVEGRFPWFTNVDKLSDGKGVGIDWTSSNLNGAWFGGSRTIPNTDTCNGAAWRKVIVDGLNQASTKAC